MKRFICKCASALLAVMLLLSPACVSEGAIEAAAADLFAEESEVAAPQDEQVPGELWDLDLPSEDGDGIAEDIAEDIPEDVTEDITEDVTEDIMEDYPQDTPEDTPEDAPEAQDADSDAAPEAPEAPETPEAPESPDEAEADAPAPEESEASASEAAAFAEASDIAAEPDPAQAAAPAPEAAPSLDLVEEAEQPKLAEAGGIPQKLVLGRKERFQLSGADAYVSSRPKVASVDATGLIRARKRGKAVITATAGGAVVGVCTVTVKAAPKKIKLPKKRTVILGQTLRLNPKIKGGACHTVTWTSRNPAVATVDANGVVTGVGVGRAKIVARTYNKKKAVCTVRVNSPDTPTSVAFPMPTLLVGMGERVTLKPVLNPGAVAVFTYQSKNKKVASVTRKGGVVKGKKLNKSAKITVKTHNGKKAALTVKVLPAPYEVTMSLANVTMNVGEVVELTALLPVGTASQIAWSSSDPSVAAVGETNPFTEGMGGSMAVTAINPGSAVITAKTYNGQTTTCKVNVNKPHSEEDDADILKLLFIGNSHTYYNSLPLMVQRRAGNAGYDCDVVRITGDGWSLQQHAEDPTVSATILNDSFDYVILQEKVNPMDADAFLAAARTLNSVIREAKAVPVIYECWARADDFNNQAVINNANRRVANDINALIAPVGELWWDYKDAHPDVNLYNDDGIHASKAGSEFAANIIWNTINSHLKGN